MGFVWFILGMMSGSCFGIVIMCLFQINRFNRYEEKNKEKAKKD